jgi:pyruvate-ferredoxin/flavodoxin oxidoreductase
MSVRVRLLLMRCPFLEIIPMSWQPGKPDVPLLASGSVQEVMDLAGVAHLSAIKGQLPFVHFFDGFRTSHEVQKIEAIDYDTFKELVDWDAIDAFRNNSLNPERPVLRGTAQNPDIFFQAKEAAAPYYNALPEIVVDYMKKISDITGRTYLPFNYYGADDAEHILVAMGSVTETIDETIDYLMEKGEKVGVIKVHLYRPFVSRYFFDVMPKTVKKIAVLDRCKEPGAPGEPLYLDIKDMFYGRKMHLSSWAAVTAWGPKTPPRLRSWQSMKT